MHQHDNQTSPNALQSRRETGQLQNLVEKVDGDEMHYRIQKLKIGKILKYLCFVIILVGILSLWKTYHILDTYIACGQNLRAINRRDNLCKQSEVIFRSPLLTIHNHRSPFSKIGEGLKVWLDHTEIQTFDIKHDTYVHKQTHWYSTMFSTISTDHVGK